MAQEFYNIRKREKVSIDDSKITKTKYESKNMVRYAFRSVDEDGTKLTKFCSKDAWDKASYPEG